MIWDSIIIIWGNLDDSIPDIRSQRHPDVALAHREPQLLQEVAIERGDQAFLLHQLLLLLAQQPQPLQILLDARVKLLAVLPRDGAIGAELDLVIHVEDVDLFLARGQLDRVDGQQGLVLAGAAKANERVFVDQAQSAGLAVELHLRPISEIDLEGIVLDQQLLDEASLIEDIRAAEEEQSVLALEGQQRGRRGGIGREGHIIAIVTDRLPFLALVAKTLSVDLVDLGIAGQPPEDIDIPLVDAASCLRSLNTEIPQGKPLPILDAVDLSLLEVAILLVVATDSKDHLASLVIDQTVARPRDAHRRDLDDLELLPIGREANHEGIGCGPHAVQRLSGHSSADKVIILGDSNHRGVKGKTIDILFLVG